MATNCKNRGIATEDVLAAAAKCRVASSGENALSWRADRVPVGDSVNTFVDRR
jgi:hypothetical protein